MERKLRLLSAIALSGAIVAVGCSLFVQIDDSKIPIEGGDASSDVSSETSDSALPDANDSSTPPPDASDSSTPPPDASDSSAPPDTADTSPVLDTNVPPPDSAIDSPVDDTSIEDSSVDALDEG